MILIYYYEEYKMGENKNKIPDQVPLRPLQLKIIGFLTIHKRVTRPQLCHFFNASNSTIHDQLRDLINKKLITKIVPEILKKSHKATARSKGRRPVFYELRPSA